MPLMRFIAASILRRCCPQIASAQTALQTWKSLPLELAANVNPFIGVSRRSPYPANLETDYYPAESESLTVANYSVKLDVLGEGSQDLRNAKQSVESLRQGNAREGLVLETSIWFIQAGHEFFRHGQHDLALRCYLNGCRLEPPHGDIISPEMRCNIGKCLLELGDFKSAGVEYLVAAEKFCDAGKQGNAASCFEQAALCWEAMDEAGRYGIGTENGFSDSTECSRRAKYLYLSIGDYIAASRCAIQEQDCLVRWSSVAHSLARRTMRWTWLYGESPVYVVRSLLLLLVIVGTLFFYFGFNRGGVLVEYDFGLSMSSQSWCDFGDALYLAVVTISTLGYGDLSPATGASKVVAGAASLSGIVLAAMFIASLQRRYVGR